jgi:hypothetical protein
MNLQGYCYSPLANPTDDIRVLELLPGDFDDDVRIRIHHHTVTPPAPADDGRWSLAEIRDTVPDGWAVVENPEGRYLFASGKTMTWEHPVAGVDRAQYELPDTPPRGEPAFEALSYVWGSPGGSGHVLVQGAAGKQEVIAVRENLMAALRRLRYPSESRTFWVDAISINQDDAIEKGFQIPRMADIFRWATRVIVWLGPESNDSALAMGTLRYLSQQFEYSVDWEYYRSPSHSEADWWYRYAQLPYNTQTWTAIQLLLDRDWCKRLWTVQEAVLAHRGATVQCGSHTMLLSELRRAVCCLVQKIDLPSPGVRSTVDRDWTMLTITVGCNLYVLLRSTRHHNCLEPRDRIYAVLGMLPNAFASKVQARYDASVSTGQIFKDFFLAHVSSTRRLDLFTYCEWTDRATDEPSWVPDFSARSPHANPIVRQFASGCSGTDAVYTNSRTLRASGVQVGTVSYVSPCLPNKWHQICEYICERLESRPEMAPETREAMLHAYASSITGGREKERWWPKVEFAPLRDWASDILQSREQASKYPAMVDIAVGICRGRGLVETTEGLVGVGPEGTQVGDRIIVLLGSTAPIITRTQQGGTRVVGECSIYGLTDAVPILGPLPPPWKVVGDWGVSLRYIFWFLNTETKELTREDPRLTPFGCKVWERFYREPDAGDPEYYDFWRNRETGEEMNSDPRMRPEVLKAHGIPIETFDLI